MHAAEDVATSDDDRNFDSEFLVCGHDSVSYTHLRAHETVLDLVCRLLLDKQRCLKVKTLTH